MIHAQFLTIILTIIYGLNEVNAKMMKLDNSKLERLNCNDHLDRLLLEINFLNQTNFYEEKHSRFALSYLHFPCKNSSDLENIELEDCNFKTLTKFNSSKQNSFKIILNSFYEYRFQLNKLNDRNLNNETVHVDNEHLCDNLNFTKFHQCDQFTLNVYSAKNCSLRLVKESPSYPIFKYLYSAVAILLFVVVVAKIIKISFFRYQVLK